MNTMLSYNVQGVRKNLHVVEGEPKVRPQSCVVFPSAANRPQLQLDMGRQERRLRQAYYTSVLRDVRYRIVVGS